MSEKQIALVADLLIYHVILGKDAKAFEQRLVGERTLESATSILHQAIKNHQSPELPMGIAIFARIIISKRYISREASLHTASYGLPLRPQLVQMPEFE